MKNYLLFIFLIYLIKFSYGQQIYEFSGLKWNGSIEQSETQLRNSGYKTTTEGPMFCKARNTCTSINFEGFGIRGTTQFKNNQLQSVSIYSSTSDDNNQRYTKLVEKYGHPLSKNIPPGTSALRRAISYGEATWRASNGEIIEFRHGYIEYKSNNNTNNYPVDNVKF